MSTLQTNSIRSQLGLARTHGPTTLPRSKGSSLIKEPGTKWTKHKRGRELDSRELPQHGRAFDLWRLDGRAAQF